MRHPNGGAKLRAVKWPIVGREQELEHAQRWLAGGEMRSVVVEGEPGIGKTEFVRQLCERCGFHRPHLVQGLETLRDEPYASLQISGTNSQPPTNLSDALARLRNEIGSDEPVVVDDAQWIDDETAEAVGHFVQEGWGQVIVTRRVDDFVSPLLAVALAGPDVLTIALGRLSRSAIRDLIDAVFGDDADGSLNDAVASASLGNPMLARELLHAVERERAGDGAIRTWHLDHQPMMSSERIVALVNDRIDTLSESARVALESVAFAEILQRSFAESVAGRTALDELERADLITTDDTTVTLRHPLLGAALRGSLSALRRSLTIQRLLDSAESAPEPDPIQIATWRLELGDQPAAADLHHAAALAFDRRDPRAERLARAAVTAGHGIAASLLLVRILRRSGSKRRFEVLDQRALALAAPGGERLVVYLTIAGHQAQHQRDFEGAIETIEAGEALETSSFARWAFAAARAQVLAQHDFVQEAAELCLDIVAAADRNPLAATHGAEHGAGLWWRLGDPLTSLRCCDAGEALDPESWRLVDLDPEWLHAHRALARLAMGHDEHAAVAAEHAYAHFRDSSSTAVGYYVMGTTLFTRGDLDAAIPMLERGMRVAERAALSHEVDDLPALLVQAYAIRGDITEALHAARRFDGTRQHHFLEYSRVVASLWLEARGRGEADSESIRAALDFLSSSGLRHYEMDLCYTLARHGRADERISQRAAAVAGSAPNPFFSVIAATVDACVRRDADALLAAAHTYFDIGRFGIAADLAMLASTSGPAWAADAVELKRAALARAPGWNVVGDPTTPAAPRWLTPRESEVAARAARGASARQIGESLGISPRTVENTLQRAYAKLGVANRSELADALERETAR